jgi:hypothetical protein
MIIGDLAFLAASRQALAVDELRGIIEKKVSALFHKK